MSDKEKKPRHPETNFLPPLNMVLTFFDKIMSKRDKKNSGEKIKEEKKVEKLIEKLSEKDR